MNGGCPPCLSMVWRDPLRLVNINEVLKRYYTDDAVRDTAFAPSPLFNFLKKA